MAFENRDMSGALFKNDDHVEGDNRPNAKGRCKINGIDYLVASWTRTGQSGVRFQSLSFEPATKPDPAGAVNAREVVGDDVPF